MLSLSHSKLFTYGASLAGVLVDGYLTITHLQGGSVVCGASHGCNTIQASKYSEILGIPIASFGLAMFITLAVLHLLPQKQRMTLLTLLSGAGVAVAAYLVYLQLFVIQAICTWCMVSASLVTLIFVVLLATNRKHP